MSESNFRLAEHQVEMTLNRDVFDDHTRAVVFTAEETEDGFAGSYTMNPEKWETTGKPETIYVTVTAVMPTTEPADEVEVFRSASTGEFVSEEFAERNPSTTMKHSFDG